MILAPRSEGSLRIQSAVASFTQALHGRVQAGLLTGQPRPRSNCRVSEASAGRFRITAFDGWTAIDVGLNEVELRCRTGVVRYRVRCWRWAAYALALSGVLGLAGAAALVALDVETYIASHPASRGPGLSLRQNAVVGWAMVVFWGFLWPWCLIGLHKRPVRGLSAPIVAEVDDVAARDADGVPGDRLRQSPRQGARTLGVGGTPSTALAVAGTEMPADDEGVSP